MCEYPYPLGAQEWILADIGVDGDNDWMDVEGGKASAEALKEAGNSKTKVHVVPNAGHHLYLDNPECSNQLLDEAIKAIPTLR